MSKIPNNYEDIYNSLPKKVRDAMTSVDVSSKIYNIGRKYNLHIDQIGDLAEEVGLAMLGVSRLKSFDINIKKRLKLSYETAKMISADINKDIFREIREALIPLQPAIKEENDTLPRLQSFGAMESESPQEGVLNEINLDEDMPQSPGSTGEAKHFGTPQDLIQKKTPSKDILKSKMEGTFSIKKEESKDTEKEKPTMPEKKIDPYREEIS